MKFPGLEKLPKQLFDHRRSALSTNHQQAALERPPAQMEMNRGDTAATPAAGLRVLI